MSRITAESIRARMEELQEQMALLEEFNEKAYSLSVCGHGQGHHEWVMDEAGHDFRPGLTPDDVHFHAHYVCSKCGVNTSVTYGPSDIHPPRIVDPWVDLRLESSSLLKATSEEEEE